MNIDKHKAILAGLLALFTAIPGINNFSETIPIQPYASKQLMWGAVTAICTVSILYLYYLRGKKAPWLILSVISLFLFITCLYSYFKLYRTAVFEHLGQRILFPLKPDGELALAIQEQGGKKAFLEYWGPDGARQFIDPSTGMLDSAEMLFATLYVLCFLLLTATFVFGLFAIETKDRNITAGQS